MDRTDPIFKFFSVTAGLKAAWLTRPIRRIALLGNLNTCKVGGDRPRSPDRVRHWPGLYGGELGTTSE
jgi:hypothetical protein